MPLAHCLKSKTLRRAGRTDAAQSTTNPNAKTHPMTTIDGDLTIHGQTRPVTLDAEIGGVVPDMRGGRRAGFSASTRISRKEWGLTWNGALESGGVLVGDEVKITMDVAIVQAEAAAANTPVAVA